MMRKSSSSSINSSSSNINEQSSSIKRLVINQDLCVFILF